PNVYPWTEGLPTHAKEDFIVLPWNDLALLQKTIAEHYKEIAAIITEPVMCNNGCILPDEGFLQGMRQICNEYDIALIFDEVITGFRLSIGGAQQYFRVTPDISIFAKAMASGYPISAVVGKREWMRVIEESRVIHAGTMNSGNTSVAAALTTIKILEKENAYDRLFDYGKRLMEGLRNAAKDSEQNLLVQGPGPMFNIAFTSLTKVKDYRDTLTFDKPKMRKFIAGMHDKGIRIIGRGLWYIGLAHTKDEIDLAIGKASEVLKNL
ncbi:MAG: aspartate aminotransferase family protein, partial [Chitinophagaceae bacterium]